MIVALLVLPILPGGCWQPADGFAHTFQGRDSQRISSLVINEANEVYFAGSFTPRVDFDPTDGSDIRQGGGPFITKLMASGGYVWTYTFGDRDTHVRGLSFAANGDVFVSGGFQGVVDFDQGPEEDFHTAPANPCECYYNTFVTKLAANASSSFWTKSFQGTGTVHSNDIWLDPDGNILICGGFAGSIDFDPGPGTSAYHGPQDYYVTKLSPEGDFLWTRTFGGSSFDYAVGVKTNSFGDVFVMGRFRFGADFDPGPGVDFHSAPAFPESFSLSRYSTDGAYLGTHVWPAGSGIAFDDFDNQYVTGGFGDAWDVDPTAGVDIRQGPAAFITKFDADGNYLWTRTLDGTGGYVTTTPPAVHGGQVYVAGTYTAVVDLDTGPGIELHDSGHYNQWDGYLITLSTDGEYLGSRVWADENFINIADLAVGPDGGLILIGDFHTRVDLDPSCAVVERTTVLKGRFEPFILKLECVEPSSDFDEDGDTDLTDFAGYQNCFTGPPAKAGAVVCDDGCPRWDLSGDDALDLADFAHLAPLLTGPK